MVTLGAFFLRLGQSILDMIVTFARDVAFQDPLSTISIFFGSLFIAGSVGVFGYLVVGALARELGLTAPTPGRGRRDVEGRVPTRPPNPEAERETAGAGRAKRDER